MSIDLGSTFATYQYMVKNSTKTLQQEAADPVIANDTAYYQANIGKVTSVDDFVNNYRLFNYAMKAYGLEDIAYAKGYMKKVLTSDLSDKNSFANKLADARFSDFAKTFGYLSGGTAPGTSDTQTVTGKYVEQSLENDAGSTDQGVQLALYFKRMASTVTSAYGLLGDSALWQVTKTVFGFPDAMASAGIDQQAKAVNERLNITDLQDPAKVDKLLTRFTAMWDITQNTASDPVLQLFDSSSDTTVSGDVGMSLLTLKYGG